MIDVSSVALKLHDLILWFELIQANGAVHTFFEEQIAVGHSFDCG